MNNKIKFLDVWLPILSLCLVGIANYWIFIVAPNERTMGPVERILYFHVSSAVGSMAAVVVILLCAIIFLWKRSSLADQVLAASAEVGFVFSTLTLATGMIWAKSAWNTYFNWEPRLVSFLIFWLMLLALNLLGAFAEKSKRAYAMSIFGILCAATMPLVSLSIHILPQAAQLHPVVEPGFLRPKEFRQAMGLAMAAVLSTEICLIWLRVRLGLLKAILDETISKE